MIFNNFAFFLNESYQDAFGSSVIFTVTFAAIQVQNMLYVSGSPALI